MSYKLSKNILIGSHEKAFLLTKEIFFLFIVFLEGFTTLAFQMVALRKAIPFVGSSILLTSIVIGIILLALSAGYYFGGNLTRLGEKNFLIKRLSLYLSISGLYYLCIVYPSFSWVLSSLLDTIGFIPTLFSFAFIFFAIPTFLASHTMPIITHIVKGTKGFAAGKILFISTIGSFLGSTLTTLVLFPQIGVYWTGIFASGILLVCSIILLIISKLESADHTISKGNVLMIILTLPFIYGIFVFRPYTQGWYEETPYQTIEIQEKNNYRLFKMNGAWSSSVDIFTKESRFPYIRDSIRIIDENQFKRVAVIGAAGCSLPQEIAKKYYTEKIDVVDIDGRVFSIAEKKFLQELLHPKITPITQSARGRVYDQIKKGQTYDAIYIDVYNGKALPDEVVTKEFFLGLQKISSNILMNVVTDQGLKSEFSKSFLATIQSAFPQIYYMNSIKLTNNSTIGNTLISTFPFRDSKLILPQKDSSIFTDDKNNSDILRVSIFKETL